MIQRLLTPGPRGRTFAAAFLLAVSTLAALQLPDLMIDRSDERLVDRHHPGWPALRALERDFGAEQSVLVYLRADDLWTTTRLKALQSVAYALEDAPGITAVDTVLNATNIRDKGNFVDAGPLVDVIPDDKARLRALRDDALYSPIMRRSYVSEDGNATAMSIAYLPDPANPEHELEIYRLIEHHIAPLREHFGTVFQLGWPRLNHEIDRGLVGDMQVLVPLSVLVLMVTVTCFLRTPRVLPIPLVTAAITILWTLGFMAAVGIPVTLLTAILPALVIVVGSVEDVHMTASYLEGIEPGAPRLRERAIAHMALHVGPAILFTSFTTMLGFASNALSDIPLIREFAIAAAFAMFANFVVTLAAMPLMLSWFGPRKNRLKSANDVPKGLIGAIVRCVEPLGERHGRLVLFVFAAVLLAVAYRIKDLEVNNDPMAYFHARHAFVQDAARIHRELAGLQTFSVTLRATEQGWFRTAAGLQAVAGVQARLQAQGLYDKTLSMADLMALMNREMHQGNERFHEVPGRQEDLDLYLSSMPRSELASFVTEDFGVARVIVRHNVADSAQINAAVAELASVLPAIVGTSATFEIAGKNLMINQAAESLIDGELQSLGLILVVVFVLFSLLYTSWLAGLLALLPNVVPLVLNFGVMAALGVPLNPGTAMVAAIAIGLAVDDTIHLMTRFGAESHAKVDERAAVRATIRGEAVPVITTSVALAAGFAVFGLSNFRIVAEFGLLAAGTMIYAAVSDLLLMPILLRHLRLATVWDIVKLKFDPLVLERCPLFAGMSHYQVKKLILLSEVSEFSQGQDLLRQGEHSSGMFVVLKGQVQIAIDDGEHRRIIDESRPGDIFGEVGFVAGDVARTATVTALTPVTAVRIEAVRAQKGLRFYPNIANRLYRNISTVLGKRLREAHERLLHEKS